LCEPDPRSLHDALPILERGEPPVAAQPEVLVPGPADAAAAVAQLPGRGGQGLVVGGQGTALTAGEVLRPLERPGAVGAEGAHRPDRKSTRLNSSHVKIS